MSRLPINVTPRYKGGKLIGADVEEIPSASWETGKRDVDTPSRKYKKIAHRPIAEVAASAAEIQRAVDDATQGLPPGEYEITIH